MEQSFFEWVRPRLTAHEFAILVNHTQPGDDGYAGFEVKKCLEKYKLSYYGFKKLLDRLEDYAQTYERQVIIDID